MSLFRGTELREVALLTAVAVALLVDGAVGSGDGLFVLGLAGVAAHLLRSRPENAEAALLEIKRVSGTAPADLRTTLGVLRDDDEDATPLRPTDPLGRLDELAGPLRGAGVDAGSRRPATGTRSRRRSRPRRTGSCRRRWRTSCATPAQGSRTSGSRCSTTTCRSSSPTTTPPTGTRRKGAREVPGGRYHWPVPVPVPVPVFVGGVVLISFLIGVGLATAILVDATLVRMVLVPAVMQLLGARAWWSPCWLRERVPRRRWRPTGGRPCARWTRTSVAIRPGGRPLRGGTRYAARRTGTGTR